MTMARLALIGGGGLAREVAEVAELSGFSVTGCYALDPRSFSAVHRGRPEDLENHKADYDAVALGIGAVDRRSLTRRKAFIELVEATGLPHPALVSPTAICATGAVIGDGAFVGHGATLAIGVQIAPYAMVNIGAIIGHDTIVGTNAIIAPGAFIGGGSVIGEHTLIGPLSKVLQGVKVGSDVILGVGCTALRSLIDGATVWPRPDRIT